MPSDPFKKQELIQFIRDEAVRIANEEIMKARDQAGYGVSLIPYHTHNGIDSVRLSAQQGAIQPAGPSGSLQYNDNGNMAGSANLSFDGFNVLTVGQEDDVFLVTAKAATTADTTGGSLQLAAGTGDGAGLGGDLFLNSGDAGDTGDGGTAQLSGGGGGQTSGNGGSIGITGGAALNNGNGGDVTMRPGDGDGSGVGGSIKIGRNGQDLLAMAYNATPAGYNVTLNAGSGQSVGATLTLQGGSGGTTNIAGGPVTIVGGTGNASGNSNGGDVTVSGGAKNGGGHVGNVRVGNGTLGTSDTGGFVMIPTMAGAPLGVPSGGAGSMVYDTSNNKLYVYNGGWKSVLLA